MCDSAVKRMSEILSTMWTYLQIASMHMAEILYMWLYVHCMSNISIGPWDWVAHSCAGIPADTRAFTLHPHCESDCMLYSSRLHFPVSANMITAVPRAEIVWERACVFTAEYILTRKFFPHDCTQVRKVKCICERQKKRKRRKKRQQLL